MSLLTNKKPEVREKQMTKSALEEEKRIAVNQYQKDNRKQNTGGYKDQKNIIDTFATLPKEDCLKALNNYIEDNTKGEPETRAGMIAVKINAVELAMIKRAMLVTGEKSIRSLIISMSKKAIL